MPRVVDPVQRRSELTEATARQIALVGLEGATMRNVARAAGWTTGALSHYFVDKNDLLLATFHSRADLARLRIEASLEEGQSLLEAVVDSSLPLDHERRVDWQVYLAFYGAAIGDAALSRAQQDRLLSFRRLVAKALVAEVAAGRLPPGLDAEHESRRFVALINGIAVQTVFEPEGWPAASQRQVVDEHLAALRATTISA